jgi:hypothetical protein
MLRPGTHKKALKISYCQQAEGAGNLAVSVLRVVKVN